MEVGPARDDEVALALARRAFSYHVMFDGLGPLDAEALRSIREAVLRVWEDAGRPQGAFTQAAMLGARLPRMIAEDADVDALEAEGVSRARQSDLAEQAAAFLASLSTEIGEN